MKLFAIQQDEQQQRNAVSVCKSTDIYNSQLPREFRCNLTASAFMLLHMQLLKAIAWVEAGATPERDDDGSLRIQGRLYSVEGSNCSCSFFRVFSLPCSHIFFLRLCQGLPLYVDGDIPADSQWAAASYVSTHSLPSSVSSVTMESHKHTRPHKKTEKFRLAIAYLKQLADEISDCGEDLFGNYMRCCEDLAANVKAKQMCAVLSMDRDGEVFDNEEHNGHHNQYPAVFVIEQSNNSFVAEEITVSTDDMCERNLSDSMNDLLKEDVACCQHAQADGNGDFVLATIPTNVAAIEPARARKRRKK